MRNMRDIRWNLYGCRRICLAGCVIGRRAAVRGDGRASRGSALLWESMCDIVDSTSLASPNLFQYIAFRGPRTVRCEGWIITAIVCLDQRDDKQRVENHSLE